MINDEEERKERAKRIIESLNDNKIDSSNVLISNNNNEEYQSRLERANNLINSINPPKETSSFNKDNDFDNKIELSKTELESEPNDENIEENKESSFFDKASYIGRRTASGVASGITGIGQAGLTDMADNLQKGKNKSIGSNIADTIGILANPIGYKATKLLDTQKKMFDIIKDKNSTLIQKVANVGITATSDALDSLPNPTNEITQLVGNVVPNLDQKVLNLNDTISKPVEEWKRKLAEESENYGVATNTMGNVGEVVGNMIPAIAVSVATQGAGASQAVAQAASLATMGISAKGQSTQEALRRGADLEQAVKIGDTKGMIEVGTEMLTGGVNIFGKGALDDITGEIVNRVNNKVARFFVKQGFDVAGETLEETISDILGTIIDKGTVDTEADYSFKDWSKTAIETTLSTLVLNVLTGGMYSDVIKLKNEPTVFKDKVSENDIGITYTTEKGQNGENIITPNFSISIENPNRKLNVSPTIIKNNRTNAYNVVDANTGIYLDTAFYDSIVDAKEGFSHKAINLSNEQIESINYRINTEKAELNTQLIEQIRGVENNVGKYQQNDTIEQNSNQNEDINQVENKTVQNGNIEEINNNNSTDNRSFEDMAFDAISDTEVEEITSPLENRDIETIGKQTNVNAYQYDNPEVKPYFQEMAQMIGEDLAYISSSENRSTAKGGGTKLNTTTEAISILHNEMGYSYDQISKGLENIIDDNGKENNAISKKLELIIDEQLRNGYTNALGKGIAPNQDYINTITARNQEYEKNKGGKENVKSERSSKNSQQKINRAEEGKNTRGEKEVSRSNGISQEKLSKSVQQFQREQQKQLGKDTNISLLEQNKLTKTERTIQKEFENITGLNYGVYESNKGTEDAVYVDNNILVKHNSLQSKKKSNFLPYHELGHWFKVNKNAEWTAIHDIIDNTITKNQIEEYKGVLKDKSMFDNMSETEIRDYIIEEIESDYFGNWANDISNWADMIRNKMLSDEYVQLLIDISDENISTHYNIFGTQEQQEQVYGKINEMMNNFITENKNSLKSNSESNTKQTKDVNFKEEFHNRIQNALINKNSKRRTNFGIVDSKTATKINKITGINVEQRKHILLDNDIRHMINEHSDKIAEAKKKQIPITPKDIELIPDVINEYDRIVKGSDNRGEQTVRYIKNIGKNKVYVVEVVPSQQNDLIIKTMWIKPIRVINSQQTPNLTSKTKPNAGNSTFVNNSIAQKNKNVKSNTTTNSNMQKSKDNTIKKSDRYDTDENNDYGFYSQLEKVIEEKMPNTSNAGQIRGIIENSGIKQDEIKWIGLDDYLKQHSLEKISKQQLQDYIKANQINIETVEKAISKLEQYTEPIKEDIASKNIDIQYLLDKYGFDYAEDLVPYTPRGLRATTAGDYMADSLETYIDLNDSEKYEKQEDGSYIRSYRDGDGIKWTTQFTKEDFKNDMQELEDLYDQRSEAESQLSMIEYEYGDYADELGVPKYEQYSLKGGTNYQELLYTLPEYYEAATTKNGDIIKQYNNKALENVDEYKSPHWEEKNVLAHARTQDFEDTQGNKVLFIDEIQSDMHQQGRKEGYETKEYLQRKEQVSKRINEIKDTKTVLNEYMLKFEKKIKEKTLDDIIKKQNVIINKRNNYTIESELTKNEQYELLQFQDKMNQIYATVIEKYNIFNAEKQQDMIDLLKSYEQYHLSESIKEKFKNKMDKFRTHIIDSYRMEYLYNRQTDIEHNWATLREDEIKNALTKSEYKEFENMKKENEKLYYELDKLQDEYSAFRNKIADVFPFKKNWHEFVLRRLINNAVEQGYDEVAWTTGKQQRERYNLAKAIDQIEYEKFYYHPNDVDKGKVGEVEIYARKNGDIIFKRNIKSEELPDYIGKDLATRILNSKENEGIISNLDESVNENPNSGMYLFYDQEIPNYLNKYLKKWNSKVEEITLKDADGKNKSKQLGFKITYEMRNSIKQNGQPLFSNRQLEEEKNSSYDYKIQQKNKEFIREYKDNIKKEDVVTSGATNAQGADRFIEQEIRKVEKTGDWDNSIPITRLTDIRKTIEDYLGLGIKKGHFRQAAYGIYKQNRDVIRGKEIKDIDNILHETGHALDLGKRLNIDKNNIASELLNAVKKHGGYENETRSVKLDEGFAEVIRTYAIIPEQAKKDYPRSIAILEELRNNDKSFDDFISKVQEQTYNYIHQNPQNRVHSNISIGEQTDKTPLTKAWLKQEIMRNVWDKDYVVKEAVKGLADVKGKTVNQLKASDNAYYLTRLVSGITDKVTSMLADGYIDENGNKLMPGLNKVGEILGDDPQRYNDLRDYLVAKRDTEYKAKTLKTGIRNMDTQYVLNKFKNDTQIKQAAKVIYNTLDGVMQYAVKNGLITEESVQSLKESNAFYVPMQRVIEGRGNQTGRKGAVSDIIKKRTGSELDIKDVLENIVANSSNIIQQVENNNVLKALYNQGEEAELTGAIYDVIPAPMIKIGTANLSMWENELKNQGVNTNKLDLEKTIDLFAPNKKVDTKNLITSFINGNGKRVYLQFNDESLFNSLMNIDTKFMSQVLQINSKLNLPLRYGATMANLGFAIPNMISDTAQASIYSNAGFVPVIDNALGVLDVLTANNKYVKDFVNQYSPEYVQRIEKMYSIYKQTGSTSSTRLSQYRESTQNVMKNVYGTKNSEVLGIHEKFKPLKRLLDILTYIPELSEQSTRFRVFEKNYDMYKDKGNSEMDSRILAALESRDATQDFGRTGNLTREINQLIPFSAARVGSSYTFAEKVKANPKQTGMRIAMLTALAIAIKGIGYDDDEIEELNQRKKDDNFVLKIGNNVVTIKKPQGILRSMINLAEYIQDLATGHVDEGKEGERLGEWITNAIMDNMPADSVTGLVPNMVAPLIENAINKDFYYNTEIVKNYDLDLPDSEQYYDYNSQLAILLGKAFNYSPAKIDNLISGYFAGLGTQVTNIMDYVSGKMGISPEKPEMGAESNAIGKRFIVNVNTNSASIDEVYNRKTELTKKQNGGTITADEETELETLKGAITNLSKVNKQIKEIKADLTTSGKEKAEQIKVLQQQKTDIARQALGKDLIHSENASKIETTTFYPSNSSLSLNNYKLELTSDMKEEYAEIAQQYYSKYESQGLYSQDKLQEIKTKAKEYAKKALMSKYKNQLVKTK